MEEFKKARTTSFSDLFIKKTAAKTSVPEDVIEAIVNHQWKSAKEITHNVNEIEIAGIGKFFVSESKTKKKIKKLEGMVKAWNILLTRAEGHKAEVLKKKIESTEISIQGLNKKLEKYD